ncbi:MAG: sulfite exporter TauE/SafE family protein [Chitinophagaceae bacterium]|nr:sulfite exporter TauE/SafE family protein [Chitinophagaceae bacterium]
MISLFLVAFSIGIVGSFHCVGMCGPLALSLPLSQNSLMAKFSGALLYNAGRIVTYSAFGLVFGLIGQTAALFGFQQWLSIVAGAIILLFIIMPKKYTINRMVSGKATSFFTGLRNRLGLLFTKKNNSSLFVIGLLNGLLPCGLVYMAVAGAIAAGDVFSSVMFMASFGLGTLPVMWSIAFFGNYIGVSVRQKIRRAYPFMMALMACLLILRGMGLGIPYVSPELNTQKTEVHGCCIKD